MSDNPWDSIKTPSQEQGLMAVRVDQEHPWDFYWSLDPDRRPGLALKYSPIEDEERRLPKLRDIEVTSHADPGDGKPILGIKLLNATHQEIFYQFCLDLVESGRPYTSERHAVAGTVSRMWRWYRLLRGTGDGLLSLERQRGLIGELLVLERLLFPNMTIPAAIDCWKGPEGAAQDFEMGSSNIETKSIGQSPSPSVQVSSEFQLRTETMGELFLSIAEVSADSSGGSNSFTLTDIADRIKTKIISKGPQALFPYEGRLSAAGFEWDHDYSAFKWSEGQIRSYKVEGEFPRITAEDIRPGIQNVRYSISVASCSDYLISEDTLAEKLRGI